MKLIALLLLLLIIVVSARKETERIVGGSATTTTTYPYQVAIVSQTGDLYQIFCGGSIISQNYVLTAAHCFREITSTSNQDRDLTNIYAVSTTKISEIDVKKRYQVLQANVHPMYSYNVDANSQIDICVLRVSTITFDATTKPVVLARSQDTSLFPPGTTSYVSGFGYTNGENIGGKSPSDNLMQVSIPVVSLDTCNQALANSGLYVNFAIVCAGADGKDACQGDSGGPLTVVVRSNVYMQIGVVVFGTVNTANPIQCGAAGNYGVYTDVSAYRSSFIEPITGPLYNLGDSGVAINNGTGSPSSSTFVTYSAGFLVFLVLTSLLM